MGKKTSQPRCKDRYNRKNCFQSNTPHTALDEVTARTRKGEEPAFARKAWNKRHSIKAGIQLCFLTDKHDPGEEDGSLELPDTRTLVKIPFSWCLSGGVDQSCSQWRLPPLPWWGDERSWQPGQVMGCLLVSAGASEQEVQQEEVGNNAAIPTVNYRLPRHAGTGMRKRSQAKF